jgi:hypothetical protein
MVAETGDSHVLGIVDVMNRTHPFDRLRFFYKRPIIVNQLLDGSASASSESLYPSLFKQFDAIVVKWIVGCGNHDTGIKPLGCG